DGQAEDYVQQGAASPVVSFDANAARQPQDQRCRQRPEHTHQSLNEKGAPERNGIRVVVVNGIDLTGKEERHQRPRAPDQEQAHPGLLQRLLSPGIGVKLIGWFHCSWVLKRGSTRQGFNCRWVLPPRRRPISSGSLDERYVFGMIRLIAGAKRPGGVLILTGHEFSRPCRAL